MKNYNDNRFNNIINIKQKNSEWDNILSDKLEKDLKDLSTSSKISNNNSNSHKTESSQKEEIFKRIELKEIPIKLLSKNEINKKVEIFDNNTNTDASKDNIIPFTNESVIFDNKEYI